MTRFAFIFILLYCSLLNSQNLSDKSVYKRVFPDDASFVKERPETADGFTCLFFGEDNLIKQMNINYYYPDSKRYIVANYGQYGELQNIKFQITEPEGYSIWGKCQFINNKTSYKPDSIYFDYELQSMDDYSITKVQCYDTEYRDLYNLDLNSFDSQEKLYSYLGIKKQDLVEQQLTKVQFTSPTKGDITYLNSNSVNLRDQANKKGNVILKVNTGTAVEIIDELGVDTIAPYGSHKWYKIKLKEASFGAYENKDLYIYGAFLEPVEQEVKQKR